MALSDKSMSGWRRAGLLVIAAALVLAAWTPIADSTAERYAKDGLSRALASFAIARTLNAAISALQGTQVSLQPAGVGAVFTPGEALDPLNDLVETLSSLLLAASVAFGAQVLLIKIGAHWVLSLLVSAAALAWVVAAWQHGAPAWLTRLLVVLALARFAVPAMALGNEAIHRAYLAAPYAQATEAVEAAQGAVKGIAEPASAAPRVAAVQPPPWWKRIFGLPEIEKAWERVSGAGELPARIVEQVTDRLERAVSQAIDLMVVFVLQTIVLPLVFLWLLLAAGRGIAALGARPPGDRRLQ